MDLGFGLFWIGFFCFETLEHKRRGNLDDLGELPPLNQQVPYDIDSKDVGPPRGPVNNGEGDSHHLHFCCIFMLAITGNWPAS